jgi:hypothetical protein
MRSSDHHYSLELALTLSSLVRNREERGIQVSFKWVNAHISPVIPKVPNTPTVHGADSSRVQLAGLLISPSTTGFGCWRFGVWVLNTATNPPTIFTLGMQADCKVRSLFWVHR